MTTNNPKDQPTSNEPTLIAVDYNLTVTAPEGDDPVAVVDTEVVKGISTKLDQGGTPGQAPLGYLNRRMIRDDGADIRWVEEDPVRGSLMTWAFTEYATGDWSLASMVDALEAKGLRTRPTPKRPSKPLGTTSTSRHTALASTTWPNRQPEE